MRFNQNTPLTLLSSFYIWFAFVFVIQHSDGKAPTTYLTKLPSVITDISLYKGPKRLECGVVKLEHKPGDFHNITIVFTFDKPVTVQKLQTAMWREKNGSAEGPPDVYRRIDNPCSHFFFKTVLLQIFNISPSCRANKGVYKFTSDLRTLFFNFFGFQSPYGHYRVQSCLLENNCNIICIKMSFTLLDKRKKNDNATKL